EGISDALARSMYRLGFRALEEVAEASVEELVTIDGVSDQAEAQALRERAAETMERLRRERINLAKTSPEAPTDRDILRLVPGVEDGGGLAVDLAGRAFGRGAWAHPRSDCLLRAARGGAQRGLKANVRIEGAALLSAVRSAADRRVEALLASARGAGKVAAGS